MRSRAYILSLMIIIIFAALSLGLLASCTIPSGPVSLGGDRVGLLYIEGIIMSGEPSEFSVFSEGAKSDHIVDVIQQAIDDKGIKALVIRINSPGGSSSASQEIFNAIKRFQSTNRPVIVSMADVAASGGYYVACPADEIFANPSTLTGSIGVAMALAGYEGLFKLLGLEDRSLYAGKFKDIGSPTRPMTDEEKKLLQDLIDQVYNQFWKDVASERGFTEEQKPQVAEGRIFNGEQALAAGLVDKLGGLHEAIARAGVLSGLGEKPVVDRLGKTGLLDQLLGMDAGTKSRPRIIAESLKGPVSDYLQGVNPIYKLWEYILVNPDLIGDQAGLKY